jgi:hypothetical protein
MRLKFAEPGAAFAEIRHRSRVRRPFENRSCSNADPRRLRKPLTAGTATFHMSDVLDRIANFALNGAKGQAGIGLKR